MCYAAHQAMQATATPRLPTLAGRQHIHSPAARRRRRGAPPPVPVEYQHLAAVAFTWPWRLQASQ